MNSYIYPINFFELCENYSTWIIKYSSENFEKPIYLVWYNDLDKNATDKILTYKTGEIFGLRSLVNFKEQIVANLESLIININLIPWLKSFSNLEINEYYYYELINLENKIKNNGLSISLIEQIVNFINLFNDYVLQDENHKALIVYSENELIKKIWENYYKNIFLAKLNKDDKFQTNTKTEFNLDSNKLSVALIKMIKAFDKKINLEF